MLFKLTEDIAECYAHAAEARQQARLATRPETKTAFEQMEERWLRLAKSYEHVRRIEHYLDETERQLKPAAK
jgi:two-component sensor histidine kinase